jgi:hypothetical protein
MHPTQNDTFSSPALSISLPLLPLPIAPLALAISNLSAYLVVARHGVVDLHCNLTLTFFSRIRLSNTSLVPVEQPVIPHDE